MVTCTVASGKLSKKINCSDLCSLIHNPCKYNAKGPGLGDAYSARRIVVYQTWTDECRACGLRLTLWANPEQFEIVFVINPIHYP